MKLISDEYRDLNRQLHENIKAGFGAGGHAGFFHVVELCKLLKTNDVLDYGCGKGALASLLPFKIKEYDPAIPGKDAKPEPADIVYCHHVLEHIEPEHLDAVLDDLERVTKKVGLIWIPPWASQAYLPDGRGTHLIVEPPEWWYEKIAARWDIRNWTLTDKVGLRVYPRPLIEAVVQPWNIR